MPRLVRQALLKKACIFGLHRYCPLTPEDEALLTEAIRDSSSLKSISLQGCRLDTELLLKLLDAMSRSQTIENINLAGNRVGEEGAKRLGAILISAETQLAKLELPNTY